MNDRKFSERLRDWRARNRYSLPHAAARLRRRGMDLGSERLRQLEEGAEPNRTPIGS
jgi:hypothetical protein